MRVPITQTFAATWTASLPTVARIVCDDSMINIWTLDLYWTFAATQEKSTNLKQVLIPTYGEHFGEHNGVKGSIPTTDVSINGVAFDSSTSAAVSGATIGSWNQAATQYFVVNNEQAT
jgi:hypothetical protein